MPHLKKNQYAVVLQQMYITTRKMKEKLIASELNTYDNYNQVWHQDSVRKKAFNNDKEVSLKHWKKKNLYMGSNGNARLIIIIGLRIQFCLIRMISRTKTNLFLCMEVINGYCRNKFCRYYQNTYQINQILLIGWQLVNLILIGLIIQRRLVQMQNLERNILVVELMRPTTKSFSYWIKGQRNNRTLNMQNCKHFL